MRISADDIAFAERLANAAGAAICPFFRAPHGLETKPDQSPVTQADRAAERAMRDLIAHEYPDDGIQGEEFGIHEGTSGRVWVLDPIDGTRAFISGRPLFGTLIALVLEGWPMLGIVDQPILKERWLGVAGQRTTFNGQPVATRRCPAMDQALLATTSPALFDDAQLHAFEHVAAGVRSTVLGGDCYNYGAVASGWIDIVVEAGLKLHDFAALVPVVEGAGGRMCDWQGEPLTAASTGEVVALGDPARADDVLEALACRGDGH